MSCPVSHEKADEAFGSKSRAFRSAAKRTARELRRATYPNAASMRKKWTEVQFRTVAKSWVRPGKSDDEIVWRKYSF